MLQTTQEDVYKRQLRFVLDDLLPHRGRHLNLFTVAEQAHVGKIRRDRVEGHLGWSRHRVDVLRHQRHVEAAQHVRELRIEPLMVANLHSELMPTGQRFKERQQSVRQGVAIFHLVFVEVRELKNDWPKFVSEKVHRLHERLKLFLAIHKNFLVRDGLRNLD